MAVSENGYTMVYHLMATYNEDDLNNPLELRGAYFQTNPHIIKTYRYLSQNFQVPSAKDLALLLAFQQ